MMGQRSHGDGDYHKEMNSEVFEEYIRNLIPILRQKGDKIALVMDNASYHSRCIEKIPTMSSKKDEIRDFLRRHNVQFEDTDTKQILVNIVKDFVDGREDVFRRRAVDELCRQHGITLIRLPPYHANFNPIELVWGWVKNEVRKVVSVTNSIQEIEARTREIMDGLPRRQIESFFRHVVNVEDEMHAFDNSNIDLNPIMDGGDHE
ncbi:hypothetical protein L596_006024 [Steinernema carpocapsae]|uniref:Tc1-like transposase DDE domain-containing protein n=1 Tax=Steinernema carpocapsae TaxID=34508 RepID=A0A4U8V272_STECR|nr:hypothetical protein L596_006024 [Steinernema carpocapsae]